MSEEVSNEVVESVEVADSGEELHGRDYASKVWQETVNNLPEGTKEHYTGADSHEKSFLDKLGEEDVEEVEEIDESESDDEEIEEETDEIEDEEESKIDEDEEELEQEDSRKDYIKVFNGENELNLPPDAELEIKVDGEMVKVKLSDFKNDLSGQQAIARRFSALDAERKALEEKHNAWNEGEAEVRKMAQEGRSLEAIDFMLTKAGLNSDDFVVNMFQQLAGPLQTYMNLSPEQQQVWAQQVQAEKARIQYESVAQENALLKARDEQLGKVRAVQEKYGLDDDQFAHLYHNLEKEMAEGSLPKQKISAELVGHYHMLLQRESWATEALNSVDPKMAQDKSVVAKVVSAASEMARMGHSVDQQAILDLVSRAYGLSSKVDKAKKVKDSLKRKGNDSALELNISENPSRSRKAQPGQKSRPFWEHIADEYAGGKKSQAAKKRK